jgi:hypothetical protein
MHMWRLLDTAPLVSSVASVVCLTTEHNLPQITPTHQFSVGAAAFFAAVSLLELMSQWNEGKGEIRTGCVGLRVGSVQV